MIRRLIAFLLVCFPPQIVLLQAQTVAESHVLLDCVTVTARRQRPPLRVTSDGTLKLNLNTMGYMPQILGNADPLRYSQLTPGIQTNNEYQGGVHVEGCENSHNMISIFGVPIYNINHLLSFFSVFNASHFSDFSLGRGVADAEASNRLGGELTFHFNDMPCDTVSGEISIGIMSSQGTLRIPLGKRTSLTLSGRVSYLNLLYNKWLKIDNSQLRYAFYDANVTIHHRISQRYTLIADFYNGKDNATMSEAQYQADFKARWGNHTEALHCLYDNSEGLRMKHTLYHSGYSNRFSVGFGTMSVKIPSGIDDWGYKFNLQNEYWKFGGGFIFHDINPQKPQVDHLITSASEDYACNSVESSIYTDRKFRLTDNISFNAGLRASLYRVMRNEAAFYSADPNIGIAYEKDGLIISAGYALRHQYLFQSGFSSIGLPTEFWYSSDHHLKPQYAHSLSLRFGAFLLDDKYHISAGAYYRKLKHQTEYSGSVLDLVSSSYDMRKALLNGKGRNYGFDIMINKRLGDVTGWISYSYSRARRSFLQNGMYGTYPAKHERPHELNLVVNYTPSANWSLGGTWTCSSGTPYTPLLYLYVLNGNLMSQFAPYNSGRLKPYCRLDFSVNYKWRKGRAGAEQGLNLSFYNATCRKNELFHRLSIDKSSEQYEYVAQTFVMRILPSVSYFYKF